MRDPATRRASATLTRLVRRNGGLHPEGKQWFLDPSLDSITVGRSPGRSRGRGPGRRSRGRRIRGASVQFPQFSKEITSRYHATLTYNAGQWRSRDTSKNRTVVKEKGEIETEGYGEPPDRGQVKALTHGDVIVLGLKPKRDNQGLKPKRDNQGRIVYTSDSLLWFRLNQNE